jgi:CheY-like chemotaxis protein
MRTILVIDDEKILLDMFGELLTDSGYDVELAEDGKEGIQKFDNGIFDLVITDLCMPGADGNAVAQHIRSSNRQFTPIIGISGTPWLFEDSYFDTFIPKTCSIDTLINTVKDLEFRGHNT